MHRIAYFRKLLPNLYLKKVEYVGDPTGGAELHVLHSEVMWNV